MTPEMRRRSLLASFALLGAVVVLAGIYGIARFSRNQHGAEAASCSATKSIAGRVAALARGEVAAVTVAADPRPLPDLAFNDADGKPQTLGGQRGRTVLLNLWATWCVPCRKEMPALDALQAELGSEKFTVVAVNIDTRDPEKPKAWLRDNHITRLGYFSDPSAKVFQDLKAAGKAFGMPTTVLVDPAGCEIASLAGPAEWAGPDALRLVRAAIGG